MEIIGIQTPIFRTRESLFDFIIQNIPVLIEGDILVITSKIVALAEGRISKKKDKEKLIISESYKTISTPWAAITLMEDGWGINAGIDESNAGTGLILLPQNPFETARLMTKKLKKHFSLKKIGVLITDTRSIPLRVGTIGRALGYAGFEPLKSYIGKKDIFGRKSRMTVSNSADALAAAAVFVMGEGNERTPIAVVRHAPIVFTARNIGKSYRQLALSPQKDIFSYLFTAADNEEKKKKPRK
jgi:coenzyme F420-0:L-glutamate ligase